VSECVCVCVCVPAPNCQHLTDGSHKYLRSSDTRPHLQHTKREKEREEEREVERERARAREREISPHITPSLFPPSSTSLSHRPPRTLSPMFGKNSYNSVTKLRLLLLLLLLSPPGVTLSRIWMFSPTRCTRGKPMLDANSSVHVDMSSNRFTRVLPVCVCVCLRVCVCA
jgi:hypothetical protein